jgi:hypothetical protein
MNSRKRLTAFTLVLCGVSVQILAAPYKAPRTELGTPDLQGVWTNATLTPVERPANLGEQRAMTEQEATVMEKRMEQMVVDADKPSDLKRDLGRGNPGGYNTFWFNPANKVAVVNGERRTSLIVDPPNGRVPTLTPRGEQAVAARRARSQQGPYDGPEQGNLGERCIAGFGSAGGPPMLPVMYNSNMQIAQSRDAVIILVEMVHDARVIRLGGSHPPAHMRKWLGDSIGRYEGDTLVVETTNFHPGHTIQIGGGASYRSVLPSANLKVTERFTRTAPNTILYQFTVEDPETFAQPWKGEIPLMQSNEAIYEYACHEGNYALPGILAGAREDDKKKN